ncbi:hypothetical protein NT6N_30190 [Oceaniferula spumae]|uniref:Soluble ligand binding domain-containing protein n=1 Tax=Oceaniferula spumae TaxID=2979115 RepID=A0AAT9FPY3_9BACT
MKLLKNLKLLAALVGFCSFLLPAHAGVIKSGDAVKISLKGVPASEQVKVDGEYRVRDSGNIRIPIINVNIQAAGKTPEQVERNIEAAFKAAEIYTSPTISLQVIEGEKKMIQMVLSVGGQVKKPGRVQYREGMTLAEAIQQAGDRTPFASKYLYLTRKNKEGKLMRYKYDFKEPKSQTLLVFPNDVITVPQRGGIIDRG